MMPTANRSPSAAVWERLAFWLRTFFVLAVLLGLGHYLHVPGLASLWPHRAAVEPPRFWRGISRPPTRPALLARIADDAEVIGVCVGDQSRAYLLTALGESPERHVINDLFGDRPVSVTYCGLTHCARVFTATRTGKVLNLNVGDLVQGKMTLQVGNVRYAHATGKNLSSPGGAPLPYAEFPHERTTWGRWRKAHPETDIFAGDRFHG